MASAIDERPERWPPRAATAKARGGGGGDGCGSGNDRDGAVSPRTVSSHLNQASNDLADGYDDPDKQTRQCSVLTRTSFSSNWKTDVSALATCLSLSLFLFLFVLIIQLLEAHKKRKLARKPVPAGCWGTTLSHDWFVTDLWLVYDTGSLFLVARPFGSLPLRPTSSWSSCSSEVLHCPVPPTVSGSSWPPNSRNSWKLK